MNKVSPVRPGKGSFARPKKSLLRRAAPLVALLAVPEVVLRCFVNRTIPARSDVLYCRGKLSNGAEVDWQVPGRGIIPRHAVTDVSRQEHLPKGFSGADFLPSTDALGALKVWTTSPLPPEGTSFITNVHNHPQYPHLFLLLGGVMLPLIYYSVKDMQKPLGYSKKHLVGSSLVLAAIALQWGELLFTGKVTDMFDFGTWVINLADVYGIAGAGLVSIPLLRILFAGKK